MCSGVHPPKPMKAVHFFCYSVGLLPHSQDTYHLNEKCIIICKYIMIIELPVYCSHILVLSSQCSQLFYSHYKLETLPAYSNNAFSLLLQSCLLELAKIA